MNVSVLPTPQYTVHTVHISSSFYPPSTLTIYVLNAARTEYRQTTVPSVTSSFTAAMLRFPAAAPCQPPNVAPDTTTFPSATLEHELMESSWAVPSCSNSFNV